MVLLFFFMCSMSEQEIGVYGCEPLVNGHVFWSRQHLAAFSGYLVVLGH